MTRATRVELVLATVFALALLVGCAASGSNKAGGQSARKVLVLTLANPLGDSQEVEGFAAEVSRLSGGTIRIDVRSGWRYGQVAYENGLIGDVRAGRADLGVAGSRAWDSVGVSSMRALGAPLLINSYALQARVLRSPLAAQMLKGIAPLGVVGLGLLPGPLRRPFGVARPLLGPSDYARLRIGVQQSLVGSATFRALGATPVWYAAEGPIPTVGGLEQAIYDIESDQFHSVRYLTANVALWPRPLVVFANRTAFAKLTPAQQRVLAQAATDDIGPETTLMRNDERVTAASVCRSHVLQFVSATPANLVALNRAVQPVYAMLDRDPQTRAQIAQIEAMRRNVPPEPAVPCPKTGTVRTPVGPLDGVYQYAVTASDLNAAGAEPSELLSENEGKFTFVFDRGHFATTTENPQACVWGYGTLSLKGGKLVLTFSDGGGIAPTNATNKPGELFTLQWSLYRDVLTLRRVAGAVSPTPLVAKPWLRVSTTPSRSYLSKRCPPPPNALPR